jgi:acetylornithine deacetylase
MKAGVVAALAAVRAIRRAAVELGRPLAVHYVSAEEDGGLGAVATLARGHRADGVVIAEPTSGTIVPANAGALTFRLEVPGLATHGSTRGRGVSAVTAFETVHATLRELEAERNRGAPALFAHLGLPWPLSVGVVRSGDWASTVPDSLVAEGRYGVAINETVENARQAFENAVARACAGDAWLHDHPVRVTWPGGRFAPAALPEGSPLLAQARSAVASVRGAEPEVLGAPYGSDLRHYLAHGIPAVQYGPGDVRYAHAVDEHVSLADTVACAQVYAVLALSLCG